MNNYYSKYIKYKNKYLYLKNINNIITNQQIGGDKPSVFSTKKINIIEYDTLNPFNGFIWFSSNLIRNYYINHNNDISLFPVFGSMAYTDNILEKILNNRTKVNVKEDIGIMIFNPIY